MDQRVLLIRLYHYIQASTDLLKADELDAPIDTLEAPTDPLEAPKHQPEPAADPLEVSTVRLEPLE